MLSSWVACLRFIFDHFPNIILSVCFSLANLELLIWNVIVQPDVKAIKKRIEDLISRDYLERDKDNANLFKYLA